MEYITFRATATTILGGIVGLLIGAPFALSSGNSISSYFLCFIFGAFGLLTGYRKRTSRGFLYLSFFAVIVLSSVLAKQISN